MIAYLVVEVHHAYKIWCPRGAVKEKPGKKENSSNSFRSGDFRRDKTAIFFSGCLRPRIFPSRAGRERGGSSRLGSSPALPHPGSPYRRGRRAARRKGSLRLFSLGRGGEGPGWAGRPPR